MQKFSNKRQAAFHKNVFPCMCDFPNNLEKKNPLCLCFIEIFSKTPLAILQIAGKFSDK